MAMNIGKLVEKFKIITGKQLSEKQMVSASPFTKKDNVEAFYSSRPEKKSISRLENGDYVSLKKDFEVETTPDFSYGWDRPHKDYNITKTIASVYDSRGRIKERTIFEGDMPLGYT